MRLEQVPLFIGVIVAILGLGLVLDAQLPEGFSQSRERRRRERTERNRPGETLMGLGVIAMAAALIGSDEWRFGTLAVLAGAPAARDRSVAESRLPARALPLPWRGTSWRKALRAPRPGATWKGGADCERHEASGRSGAGGQPGRPEWWHPRGSRGADHDGEGTRIEPGRLGRRRYASERTAAAPHSLSGSAHGVPCCAAATGYLFVHGKHASAHSRDHDSRRPPRR